MSTVSGAFVLLCVAVATGATLAQASGAPRPENDPRYVLVAGPPRAGTTWLFNAARLLVRYHDPNVISGFETSFASRDVCYWRARNVSMVVKTHALHKGFMVASQCDKISTDSLVPGFDLAVTSFRDPFETGCSLVKKDGRVAGNTCEKMMCEQHAFYHPPKVQLRRGGDPDASSVRPTVVYEMDFRDLKGGLVGDILRELAQALGLHSSLEYAGRRILRGSGDGGAAADVSGADAREAVLRLVARELELLRPLGDPVHSLRSAQHPVTLMHANHVGVTGKSAAAMCEADAGLQVGRWVYSWTNVGKEGLPDACMC